MTSKIIALIDTKLATFIIELTLFAPPALLYLWILTLFKASLDPLVVFCSLFFGLFFIFLVVSRLVDNINTKTEWLVLFLQGFVLCVLVLCMIYLDLSFFFFWSFSGIVFLFVLLVIMKEAGVTYSLDMRGRA